MMFNVLYHDDVYKTSMDVRDGYNSKMNFFLLFFIRDVILFNTNTGIFLNTTMLVLIRLLLNYN